VREGPRQRSFAHLSNEAIRTSVGDQVLRALHEDPELSQTPVVVLSADATPGRVQRLLGAGARAYLTKPLDVRQFLVLLDEALPASRSA